MNDLLFLAAAILALVWVWHQYFYWAWFEPQKYLQRARTQRHKLRKQIPCMPRRYFTIFTTVIRC